MFFLSALSLLGLVASAAAISRPRSPFANPKTEYLFSVNLNAPTAYVLGQTPLGQRVFEPITGGNFTGHLSGTVLSGLDNGFTDGDDHFNPVTVFLLQTSDGCQIMATATGHKPNVFILFETACSDYDWVNNVVAYGFATLWNGGVTLDVWQTGNYTS